jgi:hypothetical protein
MFGVLQLWVGKTVQNRTDPHEPHRPAPIGF